MNKEGVKKLLPLVTQRSVFIGRGEKRNNYLPEFSVINLSCNKDTLLGNTALKSTELWSLQCSFFIDYE